MLPNIATRLRGDDRIRIGLFVLSALMIGVALRAGSASADVLPSPVQQDDAPASEPEPAPAPAPTPVPTEFVIAGAPAVVKPQPLAQPQPQPKPRPRPRTTKATTTVASSAPVVVVARPPVRDVREADESRKELARARETLDSSL